MKTKLSNLLVVVLQAFNVFLIVFGVVYIVTAGPVGLLFIQAGILGWLAMIAKARFMFFLRTWIAMKQLESETMDNIVDLVTHRAVGINEHVDLVKKLNSLN